MTPANAQRAATEAAPAGNAEFQWDRFDSEAYFQHYYGEPHADDDLVVRRAASALAAAPPPGQSLDIVDVGTGPNLIPFLAALPRARRLTAWEFSASNVAWLRNELDRAEMRPQWRHFWRVAREAEGAPPDLPDDPLPLLRARAVVRQGSVFDLPPRTWDAATMFFCAESITSRRDEFEAACAAFANSVRPGGLLVAAFLVRSGGYEIAGRAFPVLNLSADSIAEAFAVHATGLEAQCIGIVEREIRSGYSGFVFLTGLAR